MRGKMMSGRHFGCKSASLQLPRGNARQKNVHLPECCGASSLLDWPHRQEVQWIFFFRASVLSSTVDTVSQWEPSWGTKLPHLSARFHSLLLTPGYFSQLGASHLDSGTLFLHSARGLTGTLHEELDKYAGIQVAARITHSVTCRNADTCLEEEVKEDYDGVFLLCFGAGATGVSSGRKIGRQRSAKVDSVWTAEVSTINWHLSCVCGVCVVCVSECVWTTALYLSSSRYKGKIAKHPYFPYVQ